MNSTIRTQPKVEKETFSMTVDAGHGAIDLTSELAFDRSKGTFKISVSLTTKHVNLNDDVTNQAILKDVSDVVQKATDVAIIRRKEWLELNQDGDPKQGSLFGNEEKKDDEPVFATDKKRKGNKKKDEEADPLAGV